MKKLSVPENINLEWELIPGIGIKELKRLVLFASPGVLAIIIVNLVIQDPWPRLLALIFGIVYIVCCYVFVVNNDDIGSMYDFFARKIHYHKTQQKFYYKQSKEVLRYVEYQESGQP